MGTKDRTKDKIDLAAAEAKTAVVNENDKVSHAAPNVGEKIKDAGAAVKRAGHDIKRKIER